MAEQFQNFLADFDELYRKANTLRERVPVVAAGGADRSVLDALSQAEKRGWVAPVLTGKAAEIQSLAAEMRLNLSPFRIVDTDQPAAAAVAEVTEGRGALLMKGQLPTPELLGAVLSKSAGLRTDRVIGQIVLMELQRDNRRILLSDTGISIQPTLDQRADLLHSMIEAAHCLRDRNAPPTLIPRIALVAATEKPNPAMPESIEAEQLQQRAQLGGFPDAAVQGPLSFDLAYEVDAGAKKQIAGDVVGAADGMLFPNLLSANLVVKAMMYTANCRFGGFLCGTKAPVVFMSRADTPQTRLNSLALTLQILRSRKPA